MKKPTKQNLIAISIPIVILGGIALAILYSTYDASQKMAYEQFIKLNLYSKEEVKFLDEQGFLDDIKGSGQVPKTKEEALALLKSPSLVEQKLSSSDESFEVLATKLDLKDNSYKLAFKLENKSNEKKDFYLIPVFNENQAQFQEINGVVNGRQLVINKDDANLGSLTDLYDVEKHKKELKPELAKAYDDIQNNGYKPEPIKLTLAPHSNYLAQSEWHLNFPKVTFGKSSVYLLVYGSSGGAKDDLTILNVHSHPQQGENWEVEFTTRGTADLYIIPNDQATIEDDEFVSLLCLPAEAAPFAEVASATEVESAKEGGSQKRTPQILENDVIYYPNWQCNSMGKVIHYTKRAGKHTLKFTFANQTEYAYNNPGWTVDGLDYTTRRKLTIDHDLIDAALTDLPVLVKLTDARFDWTHSNADGFDIRFTEDDGETLLKYERERHDGADYAEYWVKIGSVSADTDTDFYMYYRTTDTADGADPTNVWDANYKAVYHMDDLTTSTIDDSTGVNDGTKASADNPAEADGKIGKCQAFTDDYIDIGTGAMPDVTTIETWINSSTGNTRTILAWDSAGVHPNLMLEYVTDNKAIIWFESSNYRYWDANSKLGDGEWHHIAYVLTGYAADDTDDALFYIDGVAQNPSYTSIVDTPEAKVNAYIGGAGAYYYFPGSMDEFRISDNNRTPAEIKADYNSGNDSLLTYGDEEEIGNTAPTITSIEDYQDPIFVGDDITFSVDWNDADGEGIKMLICKSNAITAATPSCDDGEWCSDKNDYDSTDPITCAYTIQAGDVGTQNYYAFVCDDQPTCSSSTASTFTAEAASTGSVKIQGGTTIHGGTKLGK